MEEMKAYQLNIGFTVLLLLAAATVGEFFIGLYASYWWAPLMAIAVLKAFFILRDYMHVGHAFSAVDEEEIIQ